MKKFCSKGGLLFAATMAVCAFAMPAVTSAASWGPIGTHHTLDSPNLGFSATVPAVGGIVALCRSATYTAEVQSASTLLITGAAYSGCTASSITIGDCTVTSVGTRFPWTATAPSTTNIQIHGIHFDVTYENVPGSNSCNLNGLSNTVTGTLTGGHWTGNGAGQHEVIFNDAEGLVSVGALGTNVITVRGTFRDTQQTLVVNP